MKIYLAGSSREIGTVASYMALLRAAGHEITYNWVADVRSACSSGVADRHLPSEARERYARADRTGVLSADVFWLLIPETPSVGAWVELGMALGSGRPGLTIVSGDWRCSIFTALADEHFDTHGGAFARIRERVAR